MHKKEIMFKRARGTIARERCSIALHAMHAQIKPGWRKAGGHLQAQISARTDWARAIRTLNVDIISNEIV